jgi:hypothetical protein
MALYQLLEDAILERLEERVEGYTDLKFYAHEEGIKIEMPCIIVQAVATGEDPPNSPIYGFDVTVTLRAEVAGEKGLNRADLGELYGFLEDALNDSAALKTALTSGRLKVYGVSYETEDESELDGAAVDRTWSMHVHCTKYTTATTAGVLVGVGADNVAPVIALVGSSSLTLAFGDPYVEYGATATDTEDGSLTANIVTVSTVDAGTPGTYSVTYTVTDSDGASDSIVRWVTVSDPVSQYFAGPSATTGTGDGSYSDPWNLEDALGTDYIATLVSGERLNLLAGTYQKPYASGYAGNWDVDLTGVTVGPWSGNSRYAALIEGGFTVNGTDNIIEDLYFKNLEAPPGGEPTPPGTIPIPTPTNWADWGAVGVYVETTGDDTIIRNCVSEGGSGGFASFSANGVEIYGNVAFDFGWLSTEASPAHGHGLYARPETGQTMRVADNILVNTIGRTDKGNYAAQFYAETPVIGTLTFEDNFAKGSITAQSVNQYIEAVTFRNNIIEEHYVQTAAGLGGSEVGMGRPASVDLTLVHASNTYVNSMAAAINGVWTTESGTGNRVFKTDTAYWRTELRQTPGDSYNEEGIFYDFSVATGTDEATVLLNEYDTTRANIALIDLDRDGTVDVDLSGFLTSGDSYTIYHYKSLLGTAVASGTYTGADVALSIIDEAGPSDLDATDFFVIFKSTTTSASLPAAGAGDIPAAGEGGIPMAG